jgi:Zn-finger nucleic acid-binding protein
VDKRAISAGALISLAAEGIAIDGGTIGAATPVEIGAPGGPGQPVSEKTVSYARKEFRATAESRKRPPLLVEAMVDADVEIPGLNAKGKLLTLTAEPEEERRQIPSAVFGRCPKCGAELVPVPYRGIELDKCSRCQGVWLDFGELDQVVTEDNGLFGSLRRIFVDRATMQAGSRRQMSRGPTP